VSIFDLTALGLCIADLWWWARLDWELRKTGRPLIWRLLLAFFIIAVIIFPVIANRRGYYLPAFLPAAGFLWHILVLPWIVLTVWTIDLFRLRRFQTRSQRKARPAFDPLLITRSNESREDRSQEHSDLPALAMAGMTSDGALVAPSLLQARSLVRASPSASSVAPPAILRPSLVTIEAPKDLLVPQPHLLPSQRTMTRRQMLTTLAAVVPPVITAGLGGVAMEQVGKFRVRELTLPITGWPAELAGFTVAHVSDVHVGPFTTPQMLEDIVEKTNTIHHGGPADIVIFTGDLVNTTLSDLPAGIDMLRGFRSRLGTFVIEGNHDLVDNPTQFARGVERAGFPLLVDDELTFEAAPGVRLQLLGVRWRTSQEDLNEAVNYTADLRDSTAFPIVLVHHPHGWDPAVRRGLPLVLSGHTHGGQIMLTNSIGAGPLKFRYWTGVHRRQGSTLVVNNGVGNWFPLRVNAPAEILKLTLYPAAPTGVPDDDDVSNV